MMLSKNSLLQGTMLRQYRIDGVLGQGGFGITYLAYDTELQRQVAIKECFPRDFVSREGTTVAPTGAREKTDFDWALGKFVDEATTLARFDHPGIVRVLQILKEENNSAYMVLEFVNGTSLDAWLKQHGKPPDEAEIKRVLAPMVEALQVVHDNNIVHRDIAPDNIFIRENGKAVLLDFGSARQTANQFSRTMNLVVKDGYSAPEQYYTEGRQGPWTDVYAFAAVIYRALTGKRPVDAMARLDAINNGEPDPIEPLAEATQKGFYSPEFIAAVEAGLAPQVKSRPQSLSAWRPALFGEAAPAGAASSSARPTTEAPARRANERKQKRSRVAPVLATLAGVAMLAAIGVLLYRDQVGSAGPQGTEPVVVAKRDSRPDETIDDASDEAISNATGDPVIQPPAEARAEPAPPPASQAAKPEPDGVGTAEAAPEAPGPVARLPNAPVLPDTPAIPDTLAIPDTRVVPDTPGVSEKKEVQPVYTGPWSRTAGSAVPEQANAVTVSGDSIIVAGTVTTSGNDGMEGLVEAFSLSGRNQWSRQLGGPGNQVIHDVLSLNNGDLMVAGVSREGIPATDRAFLARLSSRGEEEWRKTVGSDAGSALYGMAPGPFNTIVGVGYEAGGPNGGDDGWIIAFNEFGDLQWQRHAGSPADDKLLTVAMAAGGELAMAGESDRNFWLITQSWAGETLIDRKPGGALTDRLLDLDRTPDGTIYAVGHTASFGSKTIDGIILRLMPDGKMPPQIVAEDSDDFLTAVSAGADGSIYVAGYTSSRGAGQTDGWIRKYDAGLSRIIWERVVGGTGWETVHDIALLPDQSVVVVGSTDSYGAGATDVWLLHIGNDGQYAAN